MMKQLFFALAVVALLPGCNALDGYERTYTINIENREGQRVGAGVTLRPRVVQSGKSAKAVQPVQPLP